MMATCEALRGFCDRLLGRCFRHFPCLSDRARRSSLGLKAALVLLHVVFVGVLFLLDANLVRKTREMRWYSFFGAKEGISPNLIIKETVTQEQEEVEDKTQPHSQSAYLQKSSRSKRKNGEKIIKTKMASRAGPIEGLRSKNQHPNRMRWYTIAYLLLVLATLVQYFITSFSSPGYVINAMAAGNEMHATYVTSSQNSIKGNMLQEMGP